MSPRETHVNVAEGDYKKLAPLSWEGELKPLWDKAEAKIRGGGKVGGTFS